MVTTTKQHFVRGANGSLYEIGPENQVSLIGESLPELVLDSAKVEQPGFGSHGAEAYVLALDPSHHVAAYVLAVDPSEAV